MRSVRLPNGSAVRVMLLLPDRRASFQLVDAVAAGVEGGGTMRCRDQDCYRDITGIELADAVNDGNAQRAETFASFRGDAFERRQRHRLEGFVRQSRHR